MSPSTNLDQELRKCQDILLEKHPDHYYAALFTAEEQRPLITALFTLLREVRDIPLSCQEVSVAQTKLHWWREEVERLHQGSPRHPATRVLLHHAPHRVGQQSQALLERFLDGVAMDIQYDAYPTNTELLMLLRKLGGSAGQLLGHFTAPFTDSGQESANWQQPAMTLERLERHQDFLPLLTQGRLYVPLDQLKDAGVTPEDLEPAPFRPTIELAIQTLLRETHAPDSLDLNTQLAGLQGARSALAILLSLRLAQRHRQINKATLDSMPLHPLRRLWIAWRTARQFGPNSAGN